MQARKPHATFVSEQLSVGDAERITAPCALCGRSVTRRLSKANRERRPIKRLFCSTDHRSTFERIAERHLRRMQKDGWT